MFCPTCQDTPVSMRPRRFRDSGGHLGLAAFLGFVCFQKVPLGVEASQPLLNQFRFRNCTLLIGVQRPGEVKRAPAPPPAALRTSQLGPWSRQVCSELRTGRMCLWPGLVVHSPGSPSPAQEAWSHRHCHCAAILPARIRPALLWLPSGSLRPAPHPGMPTAQVGR